MFHCARRPRHHSSGLKWEGHDSRILAHLCPSYEEFQLLLQISITDGSSYIPTWDLPQRPDKPGTFEAARCVFHQGHVVGPAFKHQAS